MKALSASICLLAILCFAACSNDKQTAFQPQQADTVRTAITYIDNTGVGRLDVVFRVSRDTFYMDSISPGTFKQHAVRDSFYYVPTVMPVRDTAGNIRKDTSIVQFVMLDKKFLLQDYGKHY